ncbi:MAG: hypothetical protein M3N56_11440 [Actinomycetota bacterium]|nr:hypothetical protein [Actinomycetota bacterium]
MAPAQLFVYSFGSDASYEGLLLGALERLESGGTIRILDTLFLHRDGESGELSAVGVRGDGAGRIVAPLLGFRMDAAERRRATLRTLGDGTSGMSGAAVEQLATGLAPGSAIAAVLIEHVWAGVLEDAVARMGGSSLAGDFVDATALTPELLAPFLRAS